MITIVIADDHAIFREGLEALLDNHHDLKVVGTVPNGDEALSLITKNNPDIAILDVSMPGKTCLEIAGEIKKHGLATKILVLTMHRDYKMAQDIIKAGVSGYILKENAFDDLIYAIKTIHSGKLYISPSLTEIMISLEEKEKEDKTIIS
ncbi:MAG: response regulator transcription factor, partial [Syntrophorhabdaceae bacterium]|nr:response regulator transcription factor [Syntrophorhabdaceae bacterium]